MDQNEQKKRCQQFLDDFSQVHLFLLLIIYEFWHNMVRKQQEAND